MSETAIATQPGVKRYIRFYHSSTKRGKDVYESAGGKLPGFALHTNGMVVPLDTGNKATLSVVAATKLLIQTDSKGKILKAYREEDFPAPVGKNKWGYPEYRTPDNPKKWTESYYVCALLWLDGAFVPVTTEFRGPSTDAVENLINNTKVACDAAKWAAMPGKAFKDSAEAHAPQGRVKAVCTLTPNKTSDGTDFIKGTCNVTPATKDDVVAFNALKDDLTFAADVTACLDAYKHRVAVAAGEVSDKEEEEETEEA